MFRSGEIAAFIEDPHKPIGGIVSSDNKRTTIASGGKRQEYDTDALCLYVKREKTVDQYPEFEREVDEITVVAKASISKILLSADRIMKHKPYSWQTQTEDEHLNKAARHILTYQLIRDGLASDDGENHLDNAITRLAMALGKKSQD